MQEASQLDGMGCSVSFALGPGDGAPQLLALGEAFRGVPFVVEGLDDVEHPFTAVTGTLSISLHDVRDDDALTDARRVELIVEHALEPEPGYDLVGFLEQDGLPRQRLPPTHDKGRLASITCHRRARCRRPTLDASEAPLHVQLRCLQVGEFWSSSLSSSLATIPRVFSSIWLTARLSSSLFASRSSRVCCCSSPCKTSSVTSEESCLAFLGEGATHLPPCASSSEMSWSSAGRPVSTEALFFPAMCNATSPSGIR